MILIMLIYIYFFRAFLAPTFQIRITIIKMTQTLWNGMTIDFDKLIKVMIKFSAFRQCGTVFIYLFVFIIIFPNRAH